jgi:3-hydroxyisobutyrate dehydrogenase
MIREMFSQTGAASRVLATHGEDIQSRENSCFFCAVHEAKEIVIALSLA